MLLVPLPRQPRAPSQPVAAGAVPPPGPRLAASPLPRALAEPSPACCHPAPAVRLQSEEVASVEVMQLMLQMGQRCPGLQVEALDSEQFFGVTLEALEPVE